MRRVATIAVALFAAAQAQAGEANFVPDHRAFAEDQRVATTLKAIADAKRFDETAARRFMPILLVDGLSLEEQDLYYEIVIARSPVSITSPFGPPFDLPPPDGAAREYMNTLSIVVDSTDVQKTLDGLWLAGPQKLKQLIDIASLGGPLTNTINVYMTRKFTAVVKESNAGNGFAPLKDAIMQFRDQLAQSDIDTDRRGRTMAYNILRDMARDPATPMTEDLYAGLRP
jgi:hypothetical protein